MAKYRKKPIVIEAERFWPDGPKIAGLYYRAVGLSTNATDEEIQAAKDDIEHFDCPRIKTLEGELIVSPGDWIITGIKGEKYPCKPDIFDATYEAVSA